MLLYQRYGPDLPLAIFRVFVEIRSTRIIVNKNIVHTTRKTYTI